MYKFGETDKQDKTDRETDRARGGGKHSVFTAPRRTEPLPLKTSHRRTVSYLQAKRIEALGDPLPPPTPDVENESSEG